MHGGMGWSKISPWFLLAAVSPWWFIIRKIPQKIMYNIFIVPRRWNPIQKQLQRNKQNKQANKQVLESEISPTRTRRTGTSTGGRHEHHDHVSRLETDLDLQRYLQESLFAFLGDQSRHVACPPERRFLEQGPGCISAILHQNLRTQYIWAS